MGSWVLVSSRVVLSPLFVHSLLRLGDDKSRCHSQWNSVEHRHLVLRSLLKIAYDTSPLRTHELRWTIWAKQQYWLDEASLYFQFITGTQLSTDPDLRWCLDRIFSIKVYEDLEGNYLKVSKPLRRTEKQFVLNILNLRLREFCEQFQTLIEFFLYSVLYISLGTHCDDRKALDWNPHQK